MSTTYNVRYESNHAARTANRIFHHFGIASDLTSVRDVRYTIETPDQERISDRVDSRFHGFTYTPYTPNSEI